MSNPTDRVETSHRFSALGHRFDSVNRLPVSIEWLSDNGSCYLAGETRGFARDIDLEPRTENHADRKSIELWNGRSTSSARSSVLCARQSLPGCRHRHAPAIGLELLSLLPPRDAAGAEWRRRGSSGRRPDRTLRVRAPRLAGRLSQQPGQQRACEVCQL